MMMNRLRDINSIVRGGSKDAGISDGSVGAIFGGGSRLARCLISAIVSILLGPLCRKCIKNVGETVLKPSYFNTPSRQQPEAQVDDGDIIRASPKKRPAKRPAAPAVKDRYDRLKWKNDIKAAVDSYYEQVKEDDNPAAEDENTKRVKEFFKTVAGEDMEIDWSELKEVLDLALKRDFEFDGFSKDVCRSMVALMDVDRTGRLGLDEFVQLWKSIRTWKNVFKMFDEDNSGHLSSFELRQALTSAGYQVNNHVLQSLVLRYGDSEGQISFDDFIMCAVKLKAMIEIFKERDVDSRNEATFTLEDWVEKTLYS